MQSNAHTEDQVLEAARLEAGFNATTAENDLLLGNEELHPDDQLLSDLHRCLDARALIPAEQEKIRQLIDKAETNVERDFRHYQLWLVGQQLTRAAQVAEVRLKHYERLRSEEDYQAERFRIVNGPDARAKIKGPAGGSIYWFQLYAWGFDPRPDSPLPVMPFYPFPFQENYITWLEQLVFDRRASGLVEKARDMGATVGALLWSVKQWLFARYFSAFLTSATEDLVDCKKDEDTLFEKARFQLRRTPAWQLPRGFDLIRDMPYMNISNPQNGSSITGGAPTANVGRQRRRTFVLGDEAAAWPHGGYPQHVALSQTTRSLIKLSSVQGMFNQFAEERHSGKANVFVMDWKEHPWKTEAWYDALPYGYGGVPMSGEAIAQEIDRNYRASQPGRILPMFDEVLNVITWEEFARVYGTDHIPITWNLARAQDVGTTADHLNVTAYAARPRKDDPHNDTIFFYREYVAPTDWPVEWIGEGKWDEDGNLLEEGLWQLEAPLNEKPRFVISLISQEGESEQRTYQYTCKRYPILFSRIKKPEANAGIAQMRALITPLPEVNPFVVYPKGHPKEGQPLIGRPRLVLIVAKEEGELAWDGQRLYRLQASTAAGQKEAREEIPLWHYPASEADKPVALRKPFKRKDDWLDDARYICRVWGPPPADSTPAEDFEDKLPEALRLDSLVPEKDEEGKVHLNERERDDLAHKWLNREYRISSGGLQKQQKKAVHWRKKRRTRS